MEKPVLSGQRNRLLASLSEADFALIQPHIVPTQLNFRKKLQSSNRDVKSQGQRVNFRCTHIAVIAIAAVSLTTPAHAGNGSAVGAGSSDLASELL